MKFMLVLGTGVVFGYILNRNKNKTIDEFVSETFGILRDHTSDWR